MPKISYLMLILASFQLCNTYKILVIFPLPMRSHNILGQGYVKALLEAGHEITYVTPFPTNKTNEKYHEVDLSKNNEHFQAFLGSRIDMKAMLNKESEMNLLNRILKYIHLTKFIQNDNLERFLSDTTKSFDVVIVEWLYSDVYAGFATVFNCPLIWSSSMEPHWMILRLIHEPSNPSFNSDLYSTVKSPFSFSGRLENLMLQVVKGAIKFFYITPAERVLYEEYFGPILTKRGRILPTYDEVVFNASFLLTNSHTLLSQPISMPPNTKEIGGYHIDPDTKPLPADLQRLLDEAEHGVIYFSMGSNAKTDFPDVLKNEFLKALREVKQTVIWKLPGELPNKPKNVHIVQWAPQQSILAHPNCRLFVTHGGLLSMTETVYFGVPVIVIPYGADHYLNAIRAVSNGFALKVDLSYEMASDLKLAIVEMLNNPKYTEKVKELSKIYHKRLVPPRKELVHWVEFVIETGGAPHLRSPALMTPWYQKIYFDFVILIIVIIYAIKYLVKKSYSKVKSLFSKQSPKKKRN